MDVFGIINHANNYAGYAESAADPDSATGMALVSIAHSLLALVDMLANKELHVTIHEGSKIYSEW